MTLEEIQAGGGGAGGAVARGVLALLSGGFALAALGRRALYGVGLLRRRRAAVPVVSVGNLVAGGTGKTPLVAWIADALRAAGHRPGVLARGYGPRVVATGLSDEGSVLRGMLGDGVPQVEDGDRVRGAASLLAAHPQVDVLVLDDGFQHWRLRRDLDLVLLDATRPFGFGHLLPRGLLRESPRSLRRADLVILTRTERVDGDGLARIREQVARITPAPVVEARTVATAVDLGARREPPSWLAGKAVIAVAGIGRPAAFFAMLEDDLGARVVERLPLADHADAGRAFWEDVVTRAGTREEPTWVVTTRKDAVKVDSDLPLAVLEIGLEFTRGEDLLRGALGRV